MSRRGKFSTTPISSGAEEYGVPFALYHRVKSQATGEPLDRRQEGIFILATLRPVGLAMLIGIIGQYWSVSSEARKRTETNGQ